MSNFKGINKLNKFNKFNIPKIDDNINEFNSYVLAGSIHKNIRKDIQSKISIGSSIYDLSNFINSRIRHYTQDTGVNGGIAFPPVLSVSNKTAHYSPTKKNDTILTEMDNVKIDFGVHVNGYMVDSAFSVYFNETHDQIHQVCKEALYEGLKHVGIEGYIKDCSKAITEVIQSSEFNIIDGLCGHNINRYNVHGGQLICNNYNKFNIFNNSKRFKKGAYAIEPFISYKKSKFYMDNIENNYQVKNSSNPLYKYFNNLIFSDSHVEYYNVNNIFLFQKYC